jgi:hypothetical protein
LCHGSLRLLDKGLGGQPPEDGERFLESLSRRSGASSHRLELSTCDERLCLDKGIWEGTRQVK